MFGALVLMAAGPAGLRHAAGWCPHVLLLEEFYTKLQFTVLQTVSCQFYCTCNVSLDFKTHGFYSEE